MIRFEVYSIVVGLVVPFIFIAIHIVLEKYQFSVSGFADFVHGLQLLLWPSSIFLMATAGHKWYDRFVVEIFVLSLVANVIVYAVFGGLLWWGLYRQRWALFLILGVIIWGWYKLMSL
jgi:hypothetical protein